MPSITEFHREQLRNSEVAFKVLDENWGKINDPVRDGNCGYYAIFEAFLFWGKDLAGKKLFTYQQKF